jgi:hypothetical protein
MLIGHDIPLSEDVQRFLKKSPSSSTSAGRDLGDAALDAYTELKTVVINI